MTFQPFSIPAVPPGGSVSSGGVPHPPAPPLLAESWLLAWQRIGGAVTIGTDRSLQPWFHPEIGCEDEQCATVLLAELLDTPGLPAAVRIIIAASLHPKRRRVA
ncbi:hypothetical protein GR702_05525 [Novosphingobium sp. FGD1]|jgi:hypothetical protein|uniref:Uncharacterized protein n=1 Tax=Novosphingobium silvae TaxID=2692619 RepID=A0A7X4GFD2_9SPHN|nr:hypothetical protein [Novosphingobium silvae]MYL97231.1 hypothetical protein [Novosphingobium silvae]